MRLFENVVVKDLEKLNSSGEKIDFSVKKAEGADVIYDKNTGLYWEIKSSAEDEVNYGGNKYSFEDAAKKYIALLNENKYGSFSDWRLPNKDELRSIMSYSEGKNALNTDIFENCPVGDYWTKNVYKLQPYFAWVLYSDFGCAIAKSMDTERYVLAVRGGNDRRFGENDKTRFVDNADGTITDNATGLMWQKGENKRVAPEEAEIICANMTLANYTDWRLPNIKEINTILNISEDSKTWFFEDVFNEEKDGAMLHYAASTVFKNHYAWVTNFTYGYDGYYGSRQAPLLFRAVRYCDKPAKESGEKAPLVITHTNQLDYYDLKGKKAEKDSVKGADSERITLPMSFSVKGNTILDNNTGLLWDNGNNEAATYKDAVAFIEMLNSSSYCGRSDWRLPKREEIRSIVSYSGDIPAVLSDVFTNTSADIYWTADDNKLDDSLAWCCYMGYGCLITIPKTEKARIKAVCGSESMLCLPSEERFAVNGDGTVTDKATGLMWMQGETPLLSFTDALKYCEELKLGGYNDWKLPNMKELGSIVNISEGTEWFFKDIFPNTNTKPQGFYMSSTIFDATFGWGCNFQFGFDGYYADRMNGKYPFRPVRKV